MFKVPAHHLAYPIRIQHLDSHILALNLLRPLYCAHEPVPDFTRGGQSITESNIRVFYLTRDVVSNLIPSFAVFDNLNFNHPPTATREVPLPVCYSLNL